MLYDVYKLSPGVYRYVGPYKHDDRRAAALREKSDQYLTTVKDRDEDGSDAVYEDHAKSGAVGGVISRTISVADAEATLGRATAAR
jgi:hypothetical protein